jgi:transposase-like protein
MRKQYSANLKAQLVLEVLKEEKALSQIASEHGIHPNQLRRWKSQALDGLPTVFADEQRATRELKATHERELEELYTEIGRLTTQFSLAQKEIWHRVCREMSGWRWSNIQAVICRSPFKRTCSV